MTHCLHVVMSVNKKTFLRTVRLSEELENVLQNDAKSKRTSVNALITTIMMPTFETAWEQPIPAAQRIEELLKEGPLDV